MRPSVGRVRRTQGLLGGRSEEVVRRVFDSALLELARSGYAGFRMDEVADDAGVNKTTIYRRWPSRRALVTALVDRMQAPLRATPLPDTGDLERDLVEAFELRFTFGRKVAGRAWARLLQEQHSPQVEAIIRDTVSQRGGEWKALVGRGIDRGELPAETDVRLVLELIRAIVDSRRSPALPDAAWITLAVRTVVAGARAGALVGATNRQKPNGDSVRTGRGRAPSI